MVTNPVYSLYRNDPDFAELLPEFVGDLPNRRMALLEFAKICDYENVRREAHKLKGTAGGYGFEELGQKASQLEATCKTSGRNAAEILKDLDELIEYLELVQV